MAAARNSRRSRRNRGRFSFLFKLLAIVAIVAAMTVGATVFFQLEQVEVAGNSRYTAQEVENASGRQIGDNLYRLNKYQIKQDILQKLPYVEELRIVRHLPSTIEIIVKECGAVARIQPTEAPEEDTVAEEPDVSGDADSSAPAVAQPADEMWLISVSGKLLEPAPEDSTAILVSGLTALSPRAGTLLAVPQAQQDKLDSLKALLSVLEERGSTSLVSEIDLTSAAVIRMRYDGRFWAKLPMGGDFNYCLRALEEVVSQRESYEKGTLDLTRDDYTVVYSPE
ncbi:MAG: FtsQ-type POTRA domain-containing protein [Oscillibacter sp.]|nr:FtsQ-type POTRA domain-containing protein [Oscillibacter sp.]